jgi:hypothetical protein
LRGALWNGSLIDDAFLEDTMQDALRNMDGYDDKDPN